MPRNGQAYVGDIEADGRDVRLHGERIADPTTHPAWTGGPQHVRDAGQVARFRNRFKNFNIS